MYPNVEISKTTKIKMPQRIIAIITYLKVYISPVLGLGGIFTMIEVGDLPNKPFWGILGTAVIAFFTYLGIKANAKAKVEVVGIQTKAEEHKTSESSDTNRTSLALQIFDRAMIEAENNRKHQLVALADQRDHFSSINKEDREHYEKREAMIREEKHDAINKITPEITGLRIWKSIVVSEITKKGSFTANDLVELNNQFSKSENT